MGVKYHLIESPSYADDVFDTYMHIYGKLGNDIAANRIYEASKKTLEQIVSNPTIYRRRYTTITHEPYYQVKVPTTNYLILYIVNEQKRQVIPFMFAYGRRDIPRLLQQWLNE